MMYAHWKSEEEKNEIVNVSKCHRQMWQSNILEQNQKSEGEI